MVEMSGSSKSRAQDRSGLKYKCGHWHKSSYITQYSLQTHKLCLGCTLKYFIINYQNNLETEQPSWNTHIS